MSLEALTPVILAGGKGSRLRPLTSSKKPKPFLRIDLEGLNAEHSLLQQTALRCFGMGPPIVVCAAPYARRVYDEMVAVGIEPALVIAEPEGRSTAPAIMAAALAARGRLLIMPSDHLITDPQTFQQAARFAAQHPGLVCLGAEPEHPSSRYGYIAYAGAGPVSPVQRFVEKPSRRQAKKILSQGKAVWNTGVFACDALDLQRRIDGLCPEITRCVRQAARDIQVPDSECKAIVSLGPAYLNAPSISIDYAILERSADIFVLPVRMGWRDIGCWSALFDLFLEKLRSRKRL